MRRIFRTPGLVVQEVHALCETLSTGLARKFIFGTALPLSVMIDVIHLSLVTQQLTIPLEAHVALRTKPRMLLVSLDFC
jgi:hypothetical protein